MICLSKNTCKPATEHLHIRRNFRVDCRIDLTLTPLSQMNGISTQNMLDSSPLFSCALQDNIINRCLQSNLSIPTDLILMVGLHTGVYTIGPITDLFLFGCYPMPAMHICCIAPVADIGLCVHYNLYRAYQYYRLSPTELKECVSC